ncbi:MAG: hypothetical protein OHK0013_37090 [Sandaracinaceae bacterium]
MLLPCPSCRRHVRAATGRCPFCAAPARSTTRIASSATGLLIVGSLAASGCGPAPAAARETTPTTDNRNVAPSDAPQAPEPDPPPPDDARVAPAYGGPPLRPAPRPPYNVAPPDEQERPAAAYGAPPMRSPLPPD